MKRPIFVLLFFILALTGLYFGGIYAYKNRLYAPVSNMIGEDAKKVLRDTVLVFQTKAKLEREVADLQRYIDQLYDVQELFEATLRRDPNLPDRLPFTFAGTQMLESGHDRFSVTRYETPFVPLSHWGRRAYVEIHGGDLWLVTAKGTVGRVALDKITGDSFRMEAIDTNLPALIRDDAFYEYGELSIKDTLVRGDQLLLSYSKLVSGDCYTLAIAAADLGEETLTFEDIFVPDECIREDNDYGEFSGNQTGGRMLVSGPGKLLFSTGEWRVRDLSQDPDSLFGKVVEIDLDTSEYVVKSMGHRNPQGLYFDPRANIIVVSEHGPDGGDEININRSPDGDPENYGWPVASYGEHYDGSQETYDKAPLHKSHTEHGFIEPDLQFSPSMSPAQVLRLPPDPRDPKRYALVMGSLGFDYREGDESLHIFDLDADYRIAAQDRVVVDDRVRDMTAIPGTNQFVMLLEGSEEEFATVAIVTVNP